ncbi:MAG TPA: hypothetical protein VFN87_15175 [Solirubrobacteraceae bacterium]|nr:hypothetical protein [Solirubrobacteraceae bacterium]
MRRRTRIVTSAAAAGAVLAGAGVGLAAIPTSQPLTSPASRPVASTQHTSDSFLAAVRAESAAAQGRVAELDRAIAAAQAKLRAEAALRAAQLSADPTPTMSQSPTEEHLTPTSHAPESPEPMSSESSSAEPSETPEVHATTGASGGSGAPHGDDGSSHGSGGDD